MSATLTPADASAHATPAKVCVLCGEPFSESGNNPWPLADSDGDCCNWCNSSRVIPARIARMTKA